MHIAEGIKHYLVTIILNFLHSTCIYDGECIPIIKCRLVLSMKVCDSLYGYMDTQSWSFLLFQFLLRNR